MHGNCIADARSAGRRLTAIPSGFQAAIAAAIVAGTAAKASAAPVEYDYVGGKFTFADGPYRRATGPKHSILRGQRPASWSTLTRLPESTFAIPGRRAQGKHARSRQRVRPAT